MPKSINKKSIKFGRKKRTIRRKKLSGGDSICSNLYPKLDLNNQPLLSNEVIGGPSLISADNKVLSCSIPTPRAPNGPVPPVPMTENMPMEGTPSMFMGKPPPRVTPTIPGPPGPGAYKPGLAGIPTGSSTSKPAQPTIILNDLVNKGTVNRDYQPILNTSLVSNSTCMAHPNNRNRVGGRSKKNKQKRKNSVVKKNKN